MAVVRGVYRMRSTVQHRDLGLKGRGAWVLMNERETVWLVGWGRVFMIRVVVTFFVRRG